MRYLPRCGGQFTQLVRSSVFRLILVYMVLFGISVLILLGFIYWATIAYMSEQTDARIDAEIAGLAEQYHRTGLRGLASLIQERITREPNGGFVYLFARRDYSPLAGNLPEWPEVEKDPEGWLNFRLAQSDPREPPHLARARTFLLQDKLNLLVGRDIEQLEISKRLIIGALGWGLAITLALSLIGGITMSLSTVRRIEAINQASREIMNGDLGKRIKTLGTGDDFDQLAENLNAMLDQIESLMDGVRQVSDNIAHDLKTPLTRLRQRMERMQRKLCDQPAVYQLVEENLIEADQLLSTFNALLRIARIESGGEGKTHGPLALEPMVWDAAELYEALAQEKDQHFKFHAEPELLIRGDRDLLFQVLANLLDNAIKYTPEGGHIELSLERRAEHVVIIVRDDGPGIPAAEREKVLQRFYRLERCRKTPGNGLGLSLVAAVMNLHQAKLELADNPNGQGLEIRLLFPLYRPVRKKVKRNVPNNTEQ